MENPSIPQSQILTQRALITNDFKTSLLGAGVAIIGVFTIFILCNAKGVEPEVKQTGINAILIISTGGGLGVAYSNRIPREP